MFAVVASTSQSTNPIVPSTGDVIWSVISFAILMFLLVKYAFPPVRKIMASRTDKIRLDIEAAEAARLEAERTLQEYQQQLREARKEATRLIEEARTTADLIKADLVVAANLEAAEIVRRGEESLVLERARVISEVRDRLGDLAVELAGKIIESEISRSATDPLVRSFIAEIGS